MMSSTRHLMTRQLNSLLQRKIKRKVKEREKDKRPLPSQKLAGSSVSVRSRSRDSSARIRRGRKGKGASRHFWIATQRTMRRIISTTRAWSEIIFRTSWRKSRITSWLKTKFSTPGTTRM